MKKYIITGGPVFTGEKLLSNHAILIENGIIQKIVPVDQLNESCDSIDTKGRLITPGFVNAHHHFYSALATGMSVKPSSSFIEILENLWWKLDKNLTEEQIRLSARWSIAQCAKSGVTSVFDHHASYGFIRGSLDIIKEEIEAAGLSAVLCFELSDRNGETAAISAIEENSEFTESNRVKKLFGLHAAFTISDETFKKIENEKTGFHIHCAEDFADVLANDEKLIERLEEFSILKPETLLVHGIHLRDSELEKIAEHGSTLVHCPDSNMHNGVGTFDLVLATNFKVKIAAGTDGMHSNILKTYKTAYEVSRNLNRSPEVGFEETFKMYKNTQNLCKNFFENTPGILEEGSRADIAILDYRPQTPIATDNIWGHILYGATENPVYATIADGKIIYINGELKYIDEQKLNEECAKAANQLWQKMVE